MKRLLLLPTLLLPLSVPTVAEAARNADGAETLIFQSLTQSQACVTNPRISTVNRDWGTMGAACESPTRQYILQNTGGRWAVTSVDDNYGRRPCPYANVPQEVALDLTLCYLDPNAPAPAAPAPAPTPTPVPTPVPAPAPAPSAPSTPSSSGARSSANTFLLCLPSGESSRVTKRKPSSCTTLGPDDSFAGALNLAKLKWKGWGKATATATGIERGFRSPASNIKVRVTASRPRANDCGGYTYTRIKSTSRYGTTKQSLPATCSD